MATVASTPGTATVRRDFCKFPFGLLSTPAWCKGPHERIAPIEVVCTKDGYLELRRTFIVASVYEVQSEEGPQSEPSAGSRMLGAVGFVGMATGPVGIVLLAAPAAATMAAASADQPTLYAYAYRALPEFFMTPAAFESDAACDAFFAALKTDLESAAQAQRAYVDAHCRFWPCKADDPQPCADPVCERRRERVDAELKTRLDEIAPLRARVRIAAPEPSASLDEP